MSAPLTRWASTIPAEAIGAPGTPPAVGEPVLVRGSGTVWPDFYQLVRMPARGLDLTFISWVGSLGLGSLDLQ